MSESIKVVARCRPLLPHEAESSYQCILLDPSKNEIILTKGIDSSSDENKLFTFDEIIEPSSTQQNVYELSAFQLVESVMEGYNGTIFAYGQTSSGKTHSMMGKPEDPDLKGLIPRCFSHIISYIHSTSKEKKYMVRCSFVEIYNEEIFDLLKMEKKPTKLEVRHSPSVGFFIKDMTQIMVNSEEEMIKVVLLGNKNKTMAETAMNSNSSRSHTLMIVNVESVESDENLLKPRITQSKLNLVDLAGSERILKSGIVNDMRLKETTKINLSLSALGNVISALVEGKSGHIPYRDSKLTKILQDSLGGNTKTVMVAAFSPSFNNYNETLSTLRYAARAKMIKNKPKVNEDPKDTLIKKYMEEIKNLKEALARGGNSAEVLKDMNEINKILAENRILQITKEELTEEMKNKEEYYLKNLNDKDKMAGLANSFQNQFFGGETNNDEEKKKLELARKRIRKQKKVHEQNLAEAKKKEEALLSQISSLQSKNTQLQNAQPSNQVLYQKYKNALHEIEDLNIEHEYEKESLLDSVRDQQKEIEFYEEILNNILSEEEIQKIRSHTIWSEARNKYIIPPFIFKEKIIKFPNLTYSQSKGLNNQNIQLREMEIDFSLKEANSDEENEKFDDIKEPKLPNLTKNFKRNDLKLRVNSPMKKKTAFEKLKLIEKRDVIWLPEKTYDDRSPSKETQIDKKKTYLRTLDTVINSYTKKYSKDKIILPQNFSVIGSVSMTNFKDMEEEIDIQTIKAKKNLNGLLEPLTQAKNEEILKEILEKDIKPLKTSALASSGKFQIRSPFAHVKSPFKYTKGKNSILPALEHKPLIILKKDIKDFRKL